MSRVRLGKMRNAVLKLNIIIELLLKIQPRIRLTSEQFCGPVCDIIVQQACGLKGSIYQIRSS